MFKASRRDDAWSGEPWILARKSVTGIKPTRPREQGIGLLAWLAALRADSNRQELDS